MAELTDAHRLDLVREFDCDIGTLWDAWTDPAIVLDWLGPPDWPVVAYSADLRVGGAWRATLRSVDGTTLEQGGEFLQIEAPRLLRFSFRWLGDNHEDGPGVDTIVTVRLSARGRRRTRMDFTQTGLKSPDSARGHEGGWNGTFDRLAGRLHNEGATE